MFAGIDVSKNHPMRRWTALASFTLQAALVAVALVYPLFHPQTLVEAFTRQPVFVSIPGGGPRPLIREASGHSGALTPFVAPIHVSTGVSFHPRGQRSENTDVGPAPEIPGIGSGSDIPNTLATAVAQPVVHPTVPARIFRTSILMEGILVHRVEPIYPHIALVTGTQGTVSIHAVISREGTVEQAELVNGSPLLARAALDAVRQWRYKPYYLNGEPVEVETQVTVKFILGH